MHGYIAFIGKLCILHVITQSQ